jgi:hypothetical protein
MNNSIPVYPAECEAGLKNQINDSTKCSVAFASRIELSSKDDAIRIRDKVASSEMFQSLAENSGQLDLYYLAAILATTGWNKNDDVFDRKEVWEARHTPVDKPFDLNHDPSIIIGHITDSRVIDDSGSVIPDITSIELLPEKFHIATDAVLYKHISSKKPEIEEMMKTIISEIKAGEWFVSMEALFDDFDYGVIYPNGKQLIVARNEETAYLTKHLRIYGGSGVYDDKKIGRLPRHIIFSGKGLVRKPANPESVIFQDVTPFFGSVEDVQEVEIKEEMITMAASDNASEVMELKQTIASLQDKLEQLDREKVEAKYQDYETTVAGHKTKIVDLEKLVEEFEARINSIGTEKEELETAKASVEEKLTEAQKTIEDKESKIAEFEAKVLTEGRISTLVSKGLDKEQAEKIVAKFADLDDEKFEAIAEMQEQLVQAKCKDDEDEKDKKAGKSDASEEEKDSAEANADEEALEDAEEDKDTAMASQGDSETDSEEELIKGLANFLDHQLHGPKKTND